MEYYNFILFFQFSTWKIACDYSLKFKWNLNIYTFWKTHAMI
jgi:hypothetical protein